MRLDEEARRVVLEQQTAAGGAPPPLVDERAPRLVAGAAALADAGADQDDRSATIRPPGPAITGRLLTAIGVVAATAMVLSGAPSPATDSDTDI